MNRTQKWAWRIFSYGFVAVLLAFMVFIYVRVPFGNQSCKTEHHVVSQSPRGDKVDMAEEYCDGLANSATATLSLNVNGTDVAEPFFVYDIEASLNPDFRWNGSLLTVAIKNEGHIYKKLERIKDITINYRRQGDS
jgi:hypothetical protein